MSQGLMLSSGVQVVALRRRNPALSHDTLIDRVTAFGIIRSFEVDTLRGHDQGEERGIRVH